MGKGDRITWKTLNGTCSGVIVDEDESYFLIKLDNGKYLIINSKSITI